MEGLTRLVSESMARHGFDRPLDYRRLQWSRWFRCESHHSLLFVPSKPGVFALAEEIMDLGDAHVAADAFVRPPTRSEAESLWDRVGACPEQSRGNPVKPSEARHAFADSTTNPTPRMLAVTQFFEDDDMAFVLDRMLSRQNPMRARLISGSYFVRYVVIEDQTQRRTICNALNQWMVTAAEKASGIGSHFATSSPATEYAPPANDAQQTLFVGDDPVERTLPAATAGTTDAHVARTCPERESKGPSPAPVPHTTAPQLESGAATNIHCPSPLPSGF
jgi:hypothetical protein